VSAGTSVLLGVMFKFTVGFSEVFTGPAKAFQSKDKGGGSKEAAITFGKGFGKMVGVLPKATLVDFPLAITEGLHHMPRLYGEEVRNHGRVKDWKSGGVVAGKVRTGGVHASEPQLSNCANESQCLDIWLRLHGRTFWGYH
jgi:sterol 3beta-glucosyltransferase